MQQISPPDILPLSLLACHQFTAAVITIGYKSGCGWDQPLLWPPIGSVLDPSTRQFLSSQCVNCFPLLCVLEDKPTQMYYPQESALNSSTHLPLGQVDFHWLVFCLVNTVHFSSNFSTVLPSCLALPVVPLTLRLQLRSPDLLHNSHQPS